MIPFHPLANLFPLIEGPEFAALVESMRTAGYRYGEEIVLLDGMILDGRNRYRAAIAAGIFPEDVDPSTRWEFCAFSCSDGDDSFTAAEIAAGPLAYVLAKNLTRRHLNESQRAMVAARIATLDHGGARRGEASEEFQGANLPLENPPAAPARAIAIATASEMVNVSPRSVKSARRVLEAGAPELVAAVEHGQLAVSNAAQATKLPADTQRTIAAAATDGRADVVRRVVRQQSRDAREIALAEKQRALPDRRYGVIYADPEWRFEPWSRETGMDRAADNHYPTSPIEDIRSRNVAAIAAEDCVLALWATAPMLPEALSVISAWGFVYKTHCIWKKLRPGNGRGTGYWFTGEHELLLIATRGHVPAPATALCGSVIEAPIGAHSEKPEAFAALLADAFPNLPRIELNARVARAGWDAWGYEAPNTDDAPTAFAGDRPLASAPTSATGVTAGETAFPSEESARCATPADSSAADMIFSDSAAATGATSPSAGQMMRSSMMAMVTNIASAELEHASNSSVTVPPIPAGDADLDIPDFLRRSHTNMEPVP